MDAAVGMRVKMRDMFMDQGHGTVIKVNYKRGWVSVEWDGGGVGGGTRIDPLLYCGPPTEQYVLESCHARE